MVLRRATPTDAIAIAAVGTETWHDTYDDIMGHDTVTDLTDDWYDPATIRDYFENDTFAAYVYERNDEVIGYAYSRPAADNDNVWRLPAVYVCPDAQGNGIGTTLVERVEADARQADCSRISLIVLASNDQARAFYEARGYERVDESDDPTVPGTREFVYQKGIDEA